MVQDSAQWFLNIAEGSLASANSIKMDSNSPVARASLESSSSTMKISCDKRGLAMRSQAIHADALQNAKTANGCGVWAWIEKSGNANTDGQDNTGGQGQSDNGSCVRVRP
jgi:hypothetical protein